MNKHDHPTSHAPAGVSLRGIATLMKEASLLDEQVTGAKDAAFESQIAPVALGLFRLVVMGEIKKGKSSFINALLGFPGLVPVASDVTTSTIYKIRFGTELRYTVFFTPEAGGPGPEPMVIASSQVGEYGTEKGNPKNQKRVDFIGVEAPSPLLRDGLVIVDTPGVGGLFKEHRDITFRHAPKSDAVFFVTDDDAPIGADEIKFLQELRTVTSLVFFVQTKGDQMEPDERRRLMEANVRILTQQAGFPTSAIRYFVVSSKLKQEGDAAKAIEDLQDSGFQPVLEFLNNELKGEKDIALARRALSRVSDKLTTLETELNGRTQIIEADTDGKRQALDDEIRDAERAVTAWSSEDRPRLANDFREELQTLRGNLNTDLLRAIRPLGPITRTTEEKLAGIDSADAIYERAKSLIDDARSEVARCLIEYTGRAERDVNALLQGLAQKAGAQLADRLSANARGGKVIAFTDQTGVSLARRSAHGGILDLGRSVVSSGTIALTITGIGALAAGVVLPALLPVAAAATIVSVLASQGTLILASIWGGWKGFSSHRSHERLRAAAEVLGAVNLELTDSQLVAQNQFGQAFHRLENEGANTLKRIVDDTTRRISDKQRQLAQRRNESREAIQKAEAALKLHRSSLAQLRQQIANLEKLLAV